MPYASSCSGCWTGTGTSGRFLAGAWCCTAEVVMTDHHHEAHHGAVKAPASHGTGHAHHMGHQAHDKHAGHSVAMFRDKFWISLLLTIPTLIWGHMLQRAFGYTAPAVPGAPWIPAAFGTA